MNTRKMLVTLPCVVALGVVLFVNVTQDQSNEEQRKAFSHTEPVLFRDEQTDCFDCHNKYLNLSDSTGTVDSIAATKAAYNAAIETMLDEAGTITHGLDTTVSPCKDHFQFVNGGWRKQVTFPKSSEPVHQTMSYFLYADVKLSKRKQEFLDSLRTVYSSTPNTTLKVIGTFYESCMTTDTLEYATLMKAKFKKNGIDSTRSQACVSRTMQHLGAAVGQAFAEDLKNSGAMERMNVLTAALKEAVIERLKGNTLMNAEEKENALDRLNRLIFRVGIPDQMIDYSQLRLSPTDYMANKETIASYRYDRWIGKIGENVRDKWKYSLLRANASYLPGDHAIEISALLFYPPFFYRNGEDFLNFAGVGYIIGHEIFHSISPQLPMIQNPAMRVAIDSFKAFHTGLGELDGWKPEGDRTFNEDVADLGGSRIAYAGWKKTVKKDKKYKEKIVDGFTPDQRFYIAMGRIWRSKWTPEGRSYGPHGPHFARVNGAAMQNPDFRNAFGCKPGDKMYLSDEQLSKIW